VTATVVRRPLMPQVVFLGQGRLSRHLEYYFSEVLKISCKSFSWREVSAKVQETPSAHVTPESLQSVLSSDTMVFLLGRDQDLAAQNQFLNALAFKGRRIHCSARVTLEGVSAWHPLASFSQNLFSANFYFSIPFIGSENSISLADSILQLPNPEIKIKNTEREKYHALCVFASNLSAVIMAHSLVKFQENFQLAPQAIFPLLQSTLSNVEKLGWKGLSGPMVRGDQESMQRNLASLDSPEEKVIYQAIFEMVQSHFLKNEKVQDHSQIQTKEHENANTRF
jgi:predicted short-subunit dehydrogenase-like oxidoreductase (DUF2520 family)